MTLPVPVVAVGRPSIIARSITRFPRDYGAALRSIPLAEAIASRRPAVLMVNGQQITEVAGQLDALLERPVVRGGLKHHLSLAIDASGEGFPILPEVVSRWHEVLDAHGIAPGRVAYLTHNELAAASYHAWLRGSGRAEGLRVLQHHPFMHLLSLRLRDAWADPDERARRLQAVLSAPDEIDRRARFLCLNNKPHPHRLVIAGHILGGGLAVQTLLSLAGATKGLAPQGMLPYLAEARRTLPRFEAAVDALAARLAELPLTIPGDETGDGLGDVVFGMPEALYRGALVSLVPETNFTRSGTERFTEKSVKALAAGHPTILAAAPGTLRLLRGVGFASFDPYIDESYDGIADAQDRLEAVFAVVERIGRMSVPDLAALLRRCLPAAEHNLRHGAETLPALMQRRLEELARVLAWQAEGAG